MTGGQLIGHAVAMITSQPGLAARATFLPLLIASAVPLWLISRFGTDLQLIEPGQPLDPDNLPNILDVLIAFAGALIGLLATVWAVVGWHRYVLLEDMPGIAPPWRGARIGNYILKAFLLGLLLVLVLGVLAGLLAPALLRGDSAPGLQLAFGVIVSFAVSYLVMRFGLVFPAAAIAKPYGLFESWQKTAPAGGAILQATLLLSLIGIVVNLLLTWSLSQSLALSIIVQFISSWVLLLLTSSLLTTLYGHLEEGRELNA